MRFSLVLAAALAASADAGCLERRQRGGRGPPDVSDCGLDAFEGHTSEALLFCSSLLKSGTATETVSSSVTSLTTTTKKVTTTVYAPTSRRPTPTPSATPSPPPESTPAPPSTPAPKPTSSPAPKPSSTPTPTPVQPSSTLSAVPSPSPTNSGCGIVAYVKTTAAYYFESSGTKNTFTACQALCKADTKCKSFGYGEANCMLFDVLAEDNTNYNPMSPYTFYDVTCPKELPVRKRQLNISLGGGNGINISLGLGSPKEISSACSCFITKGPADTTVTKTATNTVLKTATATSTVTKTVDDNN